MGEVPGRGDDPARDAGAEHHLLAPLGPGPPRLAAPVAVLLLVDAVELDEVCGFLTEAAHAVVELLGDAAAEMPARRLDLLSG